MELPKRHANSLAGSRFTPLDAEVGITKWRLGGASRRMGRSPRLPCDV